MKPSERIKEIHRSLKILAGHNEDDEHFVMKTYFEEAIMHYLDEKYKEETEETEE